MAELGLNTFNVEGIVQSSFVSAELLKTAKSRMDEAQATRDSNLAEFKALSADQSEKLAEITKLNREINELNRLLTNNRNSLKTLRKEEEKNANRRKEIDSILDKLEEGQERPDLEKEKEDLEKRNEELKALISDLQSDIKEKETLIADKENLLQKNQMN